MLNYFNHLISLLLITIFSKTYPCETLPLSFLHLEKRVGYWRQMNTLVLDEHKLIIIILTIFLKTLTDGKDKEEFQQGDLKGA